MRYKVNKINELFLVTVLVSLAASLMPLDFLFPGYTERLLFSEIILAAPGAVYLIAGKRNYAKAVRMKKLRFSTMLWLLLFTICVMPLMSMVNAISMLFVKNSTAGMMTSVISGNSYFISMLLIALIPCVFEESVYRGLFYNEYRKVSPWKGMVLSGLLFGLMHGNINQFTYAFLMGIIFAMIIEATDSILASMFMHFLINGASVTLTAVYPKLIAFMTKQYEQAVEDGNTLLMEQLSAYADGNMNLNEEVAALAANKETLGQIIMGYLPIVIGGSIIAAIVYRVIAAGEGRLEWVNSWFGCKRSSSPVPQSSITEEESIEGETEEPVNQEKAAKEEIRVKDSGKTGLITVPLIAGILICAVLMVLRELM